MLQTCETENVLEFQFEPRMDTANSARAEADLHAALAQVEAPVVFNLQRVEFICSAFLRLCLYARKQAGSHGFSVINVNPLIRRVFKIAGLDGMLKPE